MFLHEVKLQKRVANFEMILQTTTAYGTVVGFIKTLYIRNNNRTAQVLTSILTSNGRKLIVGRCSVDMTVRPKKKKVAILFWTCTPYYYYYFWSFSSEVEKHVSIF